MKHRYYVYFLVDPVTRVVFYVGKGCNNRAFQHLKETAETTRNARKYSKIEEIRRSGREPLVELRHGGLDEQTAFDLEAQWIKFLGREGLDPGGILTNIVERGEPLPEESRRRIGDKQRGSLNHRWGKKHSEEAKEARRRFNLENGIKPPSHKGKKRTEETRRKQSLVQMGKKKTPEQCAKMSKARRGIKLGPQKVNPERKAAGIAKMKATKAATKNERREKSKAAWERLSPAEKDAIAGRSKAYWDNLPEEVRQERIEKRKATMARKKAERERQKAEERE